MSVSGDSAHQTEIPSIRLAPERLVRRPRLYRMLSRGARSAVTVVIGPPGSGKTLLVASWVAKAALPGPVVWVTVEGRGSDEMAFWRSVMDGLRASGVAAGSDLLEGLTPAPRIGEGFVGRLAAGLRELHGPVVLVVDDLHHLDGVLPRAGLTALLADAPPQLRAILLTRGEPDLGLHRLRLAGQLTEVRATDLAFTLGEAHALMARAGVEISAASVTRLHRLTEGWAAGLRLAALSLADHEDPERFVAEFSGDERTVGAYLLGEVLAGRPAAVRDLLMRTSIVERVSGPLAGVLAGVADGERGLEQLENDGALVNSADSARSWFRYHPLLRDALRMELRREAPDEVAGLHRVAARWLADHGDPLEAIRHGVAAGDWLYAGELLMEHWFSLVLDGRRTTLHEMLAGMPARVVQTNAELALLMAADGLSLGRADVQADLALADRLAGDLPTARRPRFDATRGAVSVIGARRSGDVESAMVTARAFLAPRDAQSRATWVANDDLRAVTLLNLGRTELWALRLDEAETHLQEATALARRTGREYTAIACLGASAQLANLAQRPEQAIERADEAIERAERCGWADDSVVGTAYLARGGVCFSGGWLVEAEHWFGRAAAALAGRQNPDATVVLPICVGALRFAQGRHREAVTSLRAAEHATARLHAPYFLSLAATTWGLRARIRLGDTTRARLALARAGDAARDLAEWRNLAADLRLAGGDPRAALAALAVAGEPADLTTASFDIESTLFEAVAHEALGDAVAAQSAMEHALGLAQSHGRAWTFLVVPGALGVLRQHLGRRTAHAAFIAELLHRFAAPPAGRRTGARPLRASLTNRELAVLRLLATNLTAAEIASELLLSVHTVKMHMRHVYAKLDVHRRSEAVDRSRALGLLERQW